MFLDLINDSLDDEIRTFLIVVSVLLTVSKVEDDESEEVVLVVVLDVVVFVELISVRFPPPLILGKFIVSPVFVLIGANVTATLLVKFWVSVLLEFKVISIFLSGSWTVLTQLSISGLSLISPLYTITLNGFTFSTVVANACSIHPTESYFKVSACPVFWTFGSNNWKFCDVSNCSSTIETAGASCDLSEFLLTMGVNSFAEVLTRMLDNLLLMNA